MRPEESNASKARRRLLLAVGVGLGLMGYGSFIPAQSPAHPNTLSIFHGDDKQLVFQFSLNLPQVLHQLLSPATSFAAFLHVYAAMTSAAWATALLKAKARLLAFEVLTLPGGKSLRLQSWQWPDNEAIAKSLKAQKLLFNFEEILRSHLDPVLLLAHLQTPYPIHQAQLQLPAALYPIEVTIRNDKFWLTSQIPLAMVNLK